MSPTLPIGNIELLSRSDKSGFLTSRGTPESALPAIYNWIESLSPSDDCVICGSLMNLEREVVIRLLKRRIPLVVVFDDDLPTAWDTSILDAVAEGRFAALTVKDFPLIKDSIGKAYTRNQLIVTNCDKLYIGFLASGGRIDSLIAGRPNVFLLTPKC